MLYYIQRKERRLTAMAPIYNAKTLLQVATNARIAEYNRIKNDYIPAALLKINEANFSAADCGFQSATDDFNLLCMGFTTERAQNYFKTALAAELEELGFKLKIELNNGMMKVTCKW